MLGQGIDGPDMLIPVGSNADPQIQVYCHPLT